jgi:hypothetical protein
MFKKVVIFAVFLILNSYAAVSVWKDGEFLFFSYGKAYIAPADFCFALRYENEKIGNPVCTYAGDWERDTTVALYAKWLNTNLDTRLKPEDLRPRSQHIAEKIRDLKDKSLLFSTIRNDSVWFLLFEENSAEPNKMAVFSAKEDSAGIAKKIASSWFGSSPQRRLSDEERTAKKMEPDEYYARQPKNDVWFGVGVGQSRAKIPLTPDSWYRRKFSTQVINYREVPDSASLWSFMKNSSPIYSAYIGGSLYDFIGLELEFRRSSYNVKFNEVDYGELSHWSFNRYQILLGLEFMAAYRPHKNIDIKPYVLASIFYSFYTEDIETKKEVPDSQRYNYDNRFKPETLYNGFCFSLGLRTAFFENYAINLRTGMAYQGVSTSKENPIGTSTIDGFIGAALEYHIRWID